MKNDDNQVGRILTRREVLNLFVGAGAAILIACSRESSRQPSNPNLSCIARPKQTEGPYFVDEMLNRSDIRSDPSNGTVKEGVPLQLIFKISEIKNETCAPISSATVDIWHCDAMGIYSDVSDPGFNTLGQKFLRGFQRTDADGIARFTTIYPGWYWGRTVHIHFKVRAKSKSDHYEFTSQVYFDDSLTDKIHAQEPYSKKGQRALRNSGDGIFRNGGDQLLLSLTQTNRAYSGIFNIGLLIG